MKIVSISDTHGRHGNIEIPEGDMILCAGDISVYGDPFEIKHFVNWYSNLPHKYKILIVGNHDWMAEKDPEGFRKLIPSNITYLQDSEITIEGLKIYGSPWQPWFCDWAFNVSRGELAPYWARIPDDTNILLTHGPPSGNLGGRLSEGEDVGDVELFNRIFYLKQLKLHANGHIHEGYGVRERWGIKFVNAAICNIAYDPINKPIVIDL